MHFVALVSAGTVCHYRNMEEPQVQINRIARLAAMATVIIGTACAVLSTATAAGTADNAIKAAAKKSRYAFVTFYKNNDSSSREMLADVKSIQKKLASRADFVSVDISGKGDREVVARYGADRSPVPLTIVIAPNGAITAGFPREIKKTDFSDVFVSDGTAAVLKVMQSRKIAAVCLESSRTKYNKECSATARGVKSDSRLGGAVEVVTIDPSDRSESKLLKQWGVSDSSANAQLVVIAPPGRVVGKFDGSNPKGAVMASLMKSLSGGCGGGSCGPGGCN